MRAKPIIFVVLLVLLFGCSSNHSDSSKIVVFHAGSLSMPIKAIADSFRADNPNVTIHLEAAGSVECARKITELNRSADILASADYKIIDDLLIPNHADWNVLFASNELSLVYTQKSRYAEDINQDNWFEILQHSDVHFGRSDPNADPCGYRTLLLLKLAEKYYSKPNLSNTISQKDLRFIRPKEVDLIALLETGTLDYIFLYRSVAVQHGLEYLEFPSEINLGNPAYSDFYSTVSVTIRGSSPTDTLVIVGEPMVYGITIPNNADNKEQAMKFLTYFLSKSKGLNVISTMGMPAINPLIIKNKEMIDNRLRTTLTESENR